MLSCFAKATPFRFRAAVLQMIRPIAIETSHIQANVGKDLLPSHFQQVVTCPVERTWYEFWPKRMKLSLHLFEKLYLTLPVSVFAWNIGMHLSFETDDFSVPLELSLHSVIT